MHFSSLNQLPYPPKNKTGWPWTEESEILPEKMPDGSPWPKISIVTPSYNQGDFIEATIRSVLLQGYPNLEYIIIDGNSSDQSVEIIQKYSSWLTFWSSEPDQGQSDALNKGFEKATGEICAYLNSDDLLMPNALKAVAMIFQIENCMWLASQVLAGESLDQQKNRFWQLSVPSFPSFVVQQTFAQQGVFWRSDAVNKPYFNTKFNYIMDHELFVRIYQEHGKPLILNQTTAFFRYHSDSKTSNMEDILDRERKVLAEKISQQVSESLSREIYCFRKRHFLKRQINQLLNQTSNSFLERSNYAMQSLKLLFADPFPWRDRIFISASLKLLIRIVFPHFKQKVNYY